MSKYCKTHNTYYEGESCNACHMMNSDIDCCANCFYSDMQIRFIYSIQCKRHAPVIGTYKTEDGEKDYPKYPLVDINHWCGDYKRKNDRG